MAPSEIPGSSQSAAPQPAGAGAAGSILWYPASQNSGPLPYLLQGFSGLIVLSDKAAAESRLKEAPASRLIVLYQGPVLALSRDMAQGTTPGKALADWATAARAALALIRKHRGRALVLEAGAVTRHPQAALKLMALPADVLAAPAPADDPAAEGDATLQILALHTLRNDPAAFALATELEASGPDLSDGTAARETDADTLFGALQQAHRATAERAAEQARDLEAELETLRVERDQLELRTEQLNHGIDSYTAQIAEIRREVETRDGELADKTRQIDAMGVQMRALVAQTEEVRQRLEAAEVENRDKQGRIDGLEHLVDGITRSRSYRLMAPLRRLRAATKRKGPRND